MQLTPHPQSPQLQLAIAASLSFLQPWQGDAFRVAEGRYANEHDLLSGSGAANAGQRWNPPTCLTIYTCLDDSLAELEWRAQRRKAGILGGPHLPRTQVTIRVVLNRVLDLRNPHVVASLPFPLDLFISESHHQQVDGHPEILAQAFGRLAVAAGIQAIIVPAAPDPTRYNLVIYGANLDSSSILDIYGKDYLPPPQPL